MDGSRLIDKWHLYQLERLHYDQIIENLFLLICATNETDKEKDLFVHWISNDHPRITQWCIHNARRHCLIKTLKDNNLPRNFFSENVSVQFLYVFRIIGNEFDWSFLHSFSSSNHLELIFSWKISRNKSPLNSLDLAEEKFQVQSRTSEQLIYAYFITEWQNVADVKVKEKSEAATYWQIC